jgi:hypothetical protein
MLRHTARAALAAWPLGPPAAPTLGTLQCPVQRGPTSARPATSTCSRLSYRHSRSSSSASSSCSSCSSINGMWVMQRRGRRTCSSWRTRLPGRPLSTGWRSSWSDMARRRCQPRRGPRSTAAPCTVAATQHSRQAWTRRRRRRNLLAQRAVASRAASRQPPQRPPPPT